MISQRIKELRLQMRMTQEEFGERVGVTQQHIGAIEKGVRGPSPSLVFMITKKFKVKESWLNGD